mmetsp:Transcript_91246/g.158205  ORF Transcript_91246/g.158205 Transcript_91246/m.158205 type:complete len:97 (+) Transcript_91246:806-1096(+)
MQPHSIPLSIPTTPTHLQLFSSLLLNTVPAPRSKVPRPKPLGPKATPSPPQRATLGPALQPTGMAQCTDATAPTLRTVQSQAQPAAGSRPQPGPGH